MTDNNIHVQDLFLNQLIENKISVSIYLLNGIKLQGQIESFDKHAIVLSGTSPQLIYKHANSTIAPSQNFKLKNDDSS